MAGGRLGRDARRHFHGSHPDDGLAGAGPAEPILGAGSARDLGCGYRRRSR